MQIRISGNIPESGFFFDQKSRGQEFAENTDKSVTKTRTSQLEHMNQQSTTVLRLLLAAIMASAAWLVSCADGTQVVGIEGSSISGGDSKSKKKKNKKDEEGVELDEEENSIDLAGFDTPGSVEDNGDGGAPIEYPNMDFLGNGITTCKGDSLPTKVQFFSKLHQDKLELNMYAASIKADKGKAEDKANQKINQNTGITRFDRPSKEETSKLKSDGFKFASYAIFSKSVTKERQGQTYNFDKPLPVFPWPAPVSRYEELEKSGPQSWTASVTGADNFSVTVTLSVVSISGDEAKLKLQTEIHEDQPGDPNHRARYEAFPIPREAVYTVNGTARDVRMIENVNWFKGDECKGRPEQITMTYKMCRKSTSSKDEQFPCQ